MDKPIRGRCSTKICSKNFLANTPNQKANRLKTENVKDNELFISHLGQTDQKDQKLRMKIVKGYTPGPRPWMAFIQIKKSEEDPLLGRCSGSIINREWILSAAHCFCDITPCKQKRKIKSTKCGYLFSVSYDIF